MTTEWSTKHASDYLRGIANDLDSDEAFPHEAAALRVMAGRSDRNTRNEFMNVIARILEWDADSIEEAVAAVEANARRDAGNEEAP